MNLKRMRECHERLKAKREKSLRESREYYRRMRTLSKLRKENGQSGNASSHSDGVR